MATIRVPKRFAALLLALALLAALAFLAAPAVSAAETTPQGTPVMARAGDEAGDADPFHVSEESLAVAIFVPLIFLGATGATITWAWSSRRRSTEDED